MECQYQIDPVQIKKHVIHTTVAIYNKCTIKHLHNNVYKNIKLSGMWYESYSKLNVFTNIFNIHVFMKQFKSNFAPTKLNKYC